MNLKTTNPTLSLAYTCIEEYSSTRSINDDIYYYVFNINENDGFIIISGDDKAKEVLGYSNNGDFNLRELPINFNEWLNFYKEEIKYLINQSKSDKSVELSIGINLPKKNVNSVAPLLGNIKWDQNAPYNMYCPTGTVTGCVATGMAQVMKYYNWPTEGRGRNYYITRTGKIIIDVSFETTYDWENMLPSYKGIYTEEQKKAVATLMYHCGAASNMNYNKSSEASTVNMRKALVNNFNYDANIQSCVRAFFTQTEWMDIIKKELNERRPVLYKGSTSNTGHLFVCDGYDDRDLFHINWGWGGTSDGYFALSAINPTDGAITGGFNYGQEITIGIQKPTSTSVKSYILHIDTHFNIIVKSIDNKKTTFDIIIEKLTNYGFSDFNGEIGILICNDDEMYSKFLVTMPQNIKANNSLSKGILTNLSLSHSSNGKYKLYLMYKANDEANWQYVRTKVGTPQYMIASVTPTEIIFTYPDTYPKLILNTINIENKLYRDKAGKFNLSITNNGSEYNSIIAIYIESLTYPEQNKFIFQDMINIVTNETKTFNFNTDLLMSDGEYRLYVMYDKNNNIEYLENLSSLGECQTINIFPLPTVEPDLIAISPISLLNNTSTVDRNNVVLNVDIKNNEGFFADNVIAYIYSPSFGTPLTHIGHQYLDIYPHENVTIQFKGIIDLPPGRYYAKIYYQSKSDWKIFSPVENSTIYFTLVEGNTIIEDHNTTQSSNLLYPNPVSNKLYLRSEDIVRNIHIMDVSGKLIQTIFPNTSGEIEIPVYFLEQGTYFLNYETINRSTNYKFIKK